MRLTPKVYWEKFVCLLEIWNIFKIRHKWAITVVLVIIVLPIVAVLYCACKSTMPTGNSTSISASRSTNETRLNQSAKTISQQPMNPWPQNTITLPCKFTLPYKYFMNKMNIAFSSWFLGKRLNLFSLSCCYNREKTIKTEPKTH